MRRFFKILTLIVVFMAFVGACRKEPVILSPNDIDFAQVPYKTLSEYGFFQGTLRDLIPSDRVLLYEPVSQLFSDYAHKSRFVWMPEGVSASILDNEMQEIEFPDKSILIKNFYYPEDYEKPEGKRRIIETRLLVKNESKWESYPYLWNEEQTRGNYKIVGANIPVSFNGPDGKTHSIDYIQPNKNQCKSCHNQNEALKPIGPKARNLNFDLEYSNGEIKNQLERWATMGYLSNFKGKEKYNNMVDFEDVHTNLDLRAKAYLDINCAHCHRAESPANTSGLFLTYEETEDMKWGIFKTPVAAGVGAGSFTYDIYPSKADSSILIHRMKSDKAGVMMPEIGRVMVHEEGVALISEWINAMEIKN